MQGKKEFFVSFQLSQRVPENSFYLRLNEILDLLSLRQRIFDFKHQKEGIVFSKKKAL
jgi:hypothetical protein